MVDNVLNVVFVVGRDNTELRVKDAQRARSEGIKHFWKYTSKNELP